MIPRPSLHCRRASICAALALAAVGLACEDKDEGTKPNECAVTSTPSALGDDAQAFWFDFFPITGGGCAPGTLCGYLPNGPSLNGTEQDKAGLASVSYAGMTAADGTAADSASIVTGKLKAGAGARDLPLAGLVMRGTLESQTGRRPVRVRINDAATDTSMPNHVTTYDVSIDTAVLPSNPRCAAPAPSYRPLCVVPDGNGGTRPGRAVLVDAVWNYAGGVPGGGQRQESTTEFTIACVDTSAIAKCMQMGYLPWSPRPDRPEVSLAAHHQACVRAVRADFCSNGFPLTDAGTLIRIYDTLKINPKRELSKGEATWDATGAVCISQTRLQAVTPTRGTERPLSVKDYIDSTCPGKFTSTGREPWGGLCSTPMQPLDVDVIFTEFPPPGDPPASARP